MDGQWDGWDKWYRTTHPKVPDRDTVYEDGGERCTMREFFEQHQFNLPKIIIVTRGYQGLVDLHTLDNGQVMRIHCACSQKRAVAKDESGRTITIPLDYPLLFQVTNLKKKKPNSQGLRLREILADNSLPVKLEFSPLQRDVTQAQVVVRSFGKITVTNVYDETYCLANCIYQDVLDVRTILIPLYLEEVLVSTVTGIKGRRYENFLQFQRGIETAAKGIIYDGKTGNENIAIYKQRDIKKYKSKTVNENDEPEKLFRFSKQEEENTEEHCTLQSAPEKSRRPDSAFNTRETTPMSGYARDSSSLQTTLKRNSYSKRPLPPPPPPSEPKPDYVLPSDLPKLPQRVPMSRQTFTQDTTKDRGPPYVNNIGRAVVSPYEVHATQRKLSGSVNMVESLTIGGLSEKLRALKLEKHVKLFKNEKIDGQLLANLNEDILKEELKFTGIEAIKLMTFVRSGHVPQ